MTNILRQADARSLRSKIFDIKVPTETEIQTRAGKRMEVKKKVIPGYIYINMILDEDTWYLVKSTTGVIGFIGTGAKPAPLRDKDLHSILEPEAATQSKPKAQWNKNDIVRVLAGPFADFTGKVEDVNSEKEKLRVLISIFGRDTPVELDYTQVEKT
jgi:transcriptional antiterminator NusG